MATSMTLLVLLVLLASACSAQERAYLQEPGKLQPRKAVDLDRVRSDKVVVLCDGIALPLIGVTLPNEVHLNNAAAMFISPDSPLSATQGLTTANALGGLLLVVGLAYSIMPFAGFAVISGLWLLAPLAERQRVRRVSVVLLFAVCSLAGILSLLLKNHWKQPRPVGSCVASWGMPSGHAAVSFACWIFFSFDIARHGRWLRAPHVSLTAASTLTQIEAWLPAVVAGFVARAIYAISSLKSTRLGQFFLASVFLLPIGPSRVLLLDHSWIQVRAGALVGTLTAVTYLLALNTMGLRAKLQSFNWKKFDIVNDSVPGFVGTVAAPLPR